MKQRNGNKELPERGSFGDETMKEMFAAAKAEAWDAAPGFESRLMERLRSESPAASAAPLIWRAVPVAALIMVASIAATAMAGSFGGLETFFISGIGDTVAVESILRLGLF